MGRQRKLKGERNEAGRRDEVLKKVDLPYPDVLKGHPSEEFLARIFSEGAMRFMAPLAEGVAPHTLRKAVHDSLLYLDKVLDELPRTMNLAGYGHATIACRSGCNYCCTQRVTSTGPVVLALAHYLRKKLSPVEMKDLVFRIDQHVAKGATMSAAEFISSSRMCPLNVNGLCIGYEYRPYAGRAYHSLDVERCREAMEEPEKLANVPQQLERRSYESLISGAARECAARMGLDTRELEFIPALQIALNQADATERYLAGEDVFGAAHRPDVLELVSRRFSTSGMVPLPQARS